MEKLFFALVDAWHWLRVAASPALIGAALGLGAYYLLGDTAGAVAGGFLAVLGLYLGLRLANFARRKKLLAEFAYGLAPGKQGPTRGATDHEKTR